MSTNNKKGIFNEQKYRARLVKSRRGWLVKGMLFSSLMIGSVLVVDSEVVRASEWQANSVETIKAKLSGDQTSYAFSEGDTFYNIGVAVNVKWETLMASNGFAEGSQYSVPVGTSILFDGSTMTVTDNKGKVVSQTELKESDKVDKTQTFAGQKTDIPKDKVSEPVSKVVENPAEEPEKKSNTAVVERPTNEAEETKEVIVEQKETQEQKRDELIEQKKAEEARLEALLNKGNTDSSKELEEKDDVTEKTIATIEASISQTREDVVAVESRLLEAQGLQASASAIAEETQLKVNTVKESMNREEERLSELTKKVTDEVEGESKQILVQQAQEAQENVAQLTAELTVLMGQLEGADRALAEADENVASLKNESAVLNEKLTSLEQQLGQEQVVDSPKSVETDSEAEKTQNKIDDLSNEITDTNETIEDLEVQGGIIKEEAVKEDTEHVVGTETPEEGTSSEKSEPVIRNIERKTDENGKEITETKGYQLVRTGKAILTISDENGKEIHTYTTTTVYRKVTNQEKRVLIQKDESGNKLTSIEGYQLVSTHTMKVTQSLSNGDVVTTYTTTETYMKVTTSLDKVISTVPHFESDVAKKLESQVLEKDTRVTLEQASQVTNKDLQTTVTNGFETLVNKERHAQGKANLAITTDKFAPSEASARAVEVMYYFEHDTPTNKLEEGTYQAERVPGDVHMRYNGENISLTSIRKSHVNDDGDVLATLISDAMYRQYIDEERNAALYNGEGQSGHYKLLVLGDYSEMNVGVYVVDKGHYYRVSTVVFVGNSSITK